MFNSDLTLNIPYARKVLEHLQAHPEEHDQDVYGRKTLCGTVMCIAGLACQMDPKTTTSWSASFQMDDTVIVTHDVFGAHVVDLEDHAVSLLGMDETEGFRLFHEYNNGLALQRLRDMIDSAERAQAEHE